MSTELDLHNLTKEEAVKLIQRTIVENPMLDEIIAIHGYNSGCILKQMLQNPHNLHNKRVVTTYPDWNEGRTHIVLKEKW